MEFLRQAPLPESPGTPGLSPLASGERLAGPDCHVPSSTPARAYAGFPEGNRVRLGGRQWAASPPVGWHTRGWGARRDYVVLVKNDLTTRESGAAELLVLEFQPPHTAPCLWLWFGSSGGRLLGFRKLSTPQAGPCALNSSCPPSCSIFPGDSEASQGSSEARSRSS